jgi:coproporphyrinogen III oxidase-like Fe-S oxidoreductase
LYVRELPPLSLYVHLPWCVRKCPYCDFNSHEVPGEIPEHAYVAALLRDLDQHLPAIGDRPIISIFIGGGTPSLFSGETIALLLDGLRARLPLVPELEITLESNPGTVTASHLQEYRARREPLVDRGTEFPRRPIALDRTYPWAGGGPDCLSGCARGGF